MRMQLQPRLAERIEGLFATDIRAETALGIAARLDVDEEMVLDHLFALVARGDLEAIEDGSLLIFLTPEYARLLELVDLAA